LKKETEKYLDIRTLLSNENLIDFYSNSKKHHYFSETLNTLIKEQTNLLNCLGNKGDGLIDKWDLWMIENYQGIRTLKDFVEVQLELLGRLDDKLNDSRESVELIESVKSIIFQLINVYAIPEMIKYLESRNYKLSARALRKYIVFGLEGSNDGDN